MALVAYDYGSDSEDNSEEEESNQNLVALSGNNSISINNSVTEENEVQSDETSETKDTEPKVSDLLSHLPKSQSQRTEMTENEIEDFIPKANKEVKQRQKVKITIPSLSDFKEESDDEPVHKKIKLSAKGSGLLALLPPVHGEPLSNKSFVPQSVAQKNKPGTVLKTEPNKPLIPDAVKRKQQNNIALINKQKKIDGLSKTAESDDEDDIEIPETFDDEMWQKVCGRPKPKQIIHEETPTTFVAPSIDIAPEPKKPYTGLDNVAFKELVGKKRKQQNINIIDINEDEILPEKDVWMTKSLTDPACAPKKEIEDPVDPTRRRQHHITYLAQQAKANEQELQNQWAANKFSRNQSRAKYGF